MEESSTLQLLANRHQRTKAMWNTLNLFSRKYPDYMQQKGYMCTTFRVNSCIVLIVGISYLHDVRKYEIFLTTVVKLKIMKLT